MSRVLVRISAYLRSSLRDYARSTLIVAGVVALTAAAAWPVLRMAAREAPLASTSATLPAVPSAGLEAPGSLTTRTPQATQQRASNTLFQFALGSSLAITALGLLTALSLGGARTAQRLPEFSLRRAMGASRAVLIGSVSIEGVMLACAAAALTVPLIPLAEAAIMDRWPGNWAAGSLQFRFIVLAVIAAGAVLSLLLPYLVAPRPRLSGEISRPLSLLLPIVQAAASLVILTGGGLMVRHAANETRLAHTTPATGQVLSVAADAEPAERASRYRRLLARLSDSAGIVAASLGSHGLRLGLGTVETILTDCGDCAEGMIRTRLKPLLVTGHLASPDTFRALGVRMIEGRGFSLDDDRDHPRVAVVSRSLAQSGFQYGEAIGRDLRVRTGGADGSPDGEWYRVVGVVDDYVGTGYGTGQQPPMAVFLSVLQRPSTEAELFVTGGNLVAGATEAAEASALEIRRIDAEQDLLLAAQAPTRWFGRLFSVLGWTMLLIGGLGSLVVMRAWLVALIPELGLRKAVGATRYRLLAIVIGRLVMALVIAVGLAWWVAPGVRSTLTSIVGRDVGSSAGIIGAGALLLGIGALVGIAAPLRRILQVPPAGLLEHTAE